MRWGIGQGASGIWLEHLRGRALWKDLGHQARDFPFGEWGGGSASVPHLDTLLSSSLE